MKNVLITVSLFLPMIFFSQVGIKTTTPKRDLHVNGSLQITSELNVGGNSSSAGSAGKPGQALFSQGSNLPPVWATLDIPNTDPNSFKLKKAYKSTLAFGSINENDTSLLIGGIIDITVGSPNNFIYVSTGSCTFLAPFQESSPSFSYRFDFFLDGTKVETTPLDVIQRQGFLDAVKSNQYQFVITNVAPGKHTIFMNAVRMKSIGTNRSLYFNTTDGVIAKQGSIVAFVYEN